MQRILYLLILGQLSVNTYAQSFNHEAFKQMVDTTISHTVKEIDARDLTYDSSVVYLDAREIGEYKVSRIKNAQWVGYNDFNLSRVKGLHKTDKIIVYCSIGYRSEKIAEKLKQTGYTNVENMVGGIFEWVNCEKPVVDSTGVETNKVHAYNPDWGKWLDSSKVEKVYH